jgi:bacillithiol system protein YtxJ
MNWIALTENAQLDELILQSHEKPVVIFKHSTRCVISRFALKNFEAAFYYENEILPYFVDLLNYRSISDDIARRFLVAHQSPQILVIDRGVSVYNASHESIDAQDLKQFLR